jgi:hypothetical protein
MMGTMSQFSQGPGWWLASDGKWYPPEAAASQPSQPPQQSQQWGQPVSGSYPPARPGMNGLAIAALVCGILWGFGLLSVVALILGIIAIGQTKPGGQRGRGLAIAGVVLGGVGVVGAIASVALVVAVSDDIRDIGTPAVVAIQAEEDACWSITIRHSSRTTVRNSGCGVAAFSMGEGIDREAVVIKRSGPGTITVVVTIDEEERDRGTVSSISDSVTVSP